MRSLVELGQLSLMASDVVLVLVLGCSWDKSTVLCPVLGFEGPALFLALACQTLCAELLYFSSVTFLLVYEKGGFVTFCRVITVNLHKLSTETSVF